VVFFKFQISFWLSEFTCLRQQPGQLRTSCWTSLTTVKTTMICGHLTEYLHSQTAKSKAVPLRHAGAKRERKYSSYSFFTLALDGGEWSASRPGRALPLGKDPPPPKPNGWVDLRAGLNTKARGKFLFLCQSTKPGRPVCR
jgi:hypothetical protein